MKSLLRLLPLPLLLVEQIHVLLHHFGVHLPLEGRHCLLRLHLGLVLQPGLGRLCPQHLGLGGSGGLLLGQPSQVVRRYRRLLLRLPLGSEIAGLSSGLELRT